MVTPCRFFSALIYATRPGRMGHFVELINIAQPTSGNA